MLPVVRRLRLPKFVSAFSSAKPEGQVKRQSADVKTTPPEPRKQFNYHYHWVENMSCFHPFPVEMEIPIHVFLLLLQVGR